MSIRNSHNDTNLQYIQHQMEFQQSQQLTPYKLQYARSQLNKTGRSIVD